jgi:hypothetical protein
MDEMGEWRLITRKYDWWGSGEGSLIWREHEEWETLIGGDETQGYNDWIDSFATLQRRNAGSRGRNNSTTTSKEDEGKFL